MEVQPEGVQLRPTVGEGNVGLPPGIDGVERLDLVRHQDHRGWLTPAIDLELPFWRDGIVYSYAMTVAPGRIKGWGMHRLQADRYVALQGLLRVALYDGRRASPTFGATASVWFSPSRPGALRIPPGVWHAAQNAGADDVLVMNFPTVAYRPQDPDKFHVDIGSPEIPFDLTLGDL